MKDNIIVSVIFGTLMFIMLVIAYIILALTYTCFPKGNELDFTIPFLEVVIVYLICVFSALILNISK